MVSDFIDILPRYVNFLFYKMIVAMKLVVEELFVNIAAHKATR